MILSIKESGAREAALGFRRLEGDVSDLRPAWPQVATYFHDTEVLAFASEGGDTARGKWKPLSAKYAAWKAKHFPGKGILERTGALRDSLTGGKGRRTISERLRYTEESLVPYAIFHERGSGVLPRRSPVSLTERQMRGIGAIIGRHINANIRKHFSKVGV